MANGTMAGWSSNSKRVLERKCRYKASHQEALLLERLFVFWGRKVRTFVVH